jgi:hypothetical protein
MRVKTFTQKLVLEFRFKAKPSLLGRIGEVADAWVDEFPEINIDIPRIRMTDKAGYRVLTFNLHHALLEVEGQADFMQFLPITERLGQRVLEDIMPEDVARLGLRQYEIVDKISRKRALEAITSTFFVSTVQWPNSESPNAISDLAITLEFMSHPPQQGRIQFGPYVKEANQHFFTFRDHRVLKNLEEGFIFDCDYGEIHVPSEVLQPERLRTWLINAHKTSRGRVATLLNAMGFEVST